MRALTNAMRVRLVSRHPIDDTGCSLAKLNWFHVWLHLLVGRNRLSLRVGWSVRIGSGQSGSCRVDNSIRLSYMSFISFSIVELVFLNILYLKQKQRDSRNVVSLSMFTVLPGALNSMFTPKHTTMPMNRTDHSVKVRFRFRFRFLLLAYTSRASGIRSASTYKKFLDNLNSPHDIMRCQLNYEKREN